MFLLFLFLTLLLAVQIIQPGKQPLIPELLIVTLII
jgi:hypothetical protein